MGQERKRKDGTVTVATTIYVSKPAHREAVLRGKPVNKSKSAVFVEIIENNLLKRV
jgi:hypothetical protein